MQLGLEVYKMKLKSLLYGTAAVLVSTGASTGAMAADLPVAAEPVEYVRVCDAFGKGFFYIPGTDTCLKVGGRVRIEAYFNDTDDDNDDFYETRARGYMNLDARNETDYGLLRAYVAMWWTLGAGGNNPTAYDNDYNQAYGPATNLDKAFITLSNDAGQWTFGLAGSFFDFFAGNTYSAPLDPTNDATLFAYTFNIGNGVSASVSLEDPYSEGRKLSRFDAGAPAGGGAGPSAFYGGQDFPDLVGNVRVDQGWGTLQIMGALRDVKSKAIGTQVAPGVFVPCCIDDKLGWAAGAGVTVAMPGAPVELSLQGAYTQGMVRYITPPQDVGFDAYAVAPFNTELTEAWAVSGGVTIEAGQDVDFIVDAYYADLDHAGAIATWDYNQWAIAGTLQWTGISGLVIGADLGYVDVNPDLGAVGINNGVDYSSWQGRIRFQRSF